MVNSVDITNIKRELSARKVSGYKVDPGGTLGIDEIKGKTTQDLKKLIEEYEDRKRDEATKKLKTLVTGIFEKYGEPEDNMIALSSAYVPGREIYEDEEGPLECINFSDTKWNKLYHPVHPSSGELGYGDSEDGPSEELEAWNKRQEEYYDDIQELNPLLQDLDIPEACEYWEDNNHALNEYWHGVIGIMRDFRVVAFVIRDDGLLCDSEGYTTFHNEILQSL